MPISPENIKLMASQRLTDYSDGGGRMSGIEIVDGNVNNLFPDISRLDRTYGRVSLRKAFVSVQSLDTDTYSGAHVILSVPAADPKVNVCLFTTNNPHDERVAARDRIESYVVKGPRFSGWLWGDQPEGARSILIFAVKGTTAPDIGSVLYLVNNQGLSTEESQYVRVTGIEVSRSEFASTSDGTYGERALAFSRDIFQIEIGDPLRHTFKGVEITKNDSVATTVYTTTVYDAARYYGVMQPTVDLSAGDIAINVDSIFTHLVPSAQGEAPLTDLSIGEAGPVMDAGESYTVTASSFAMKEGAQFSFGRGIKRGSLSFSCGGHTYTDTGDGLVYEGTAQRGVIDYGEGTITFSGVGTYTGTAAATAVIGAEVPRVANTRMVEVALSNQGYNYTAILSPLPAKGTVMVDYMSQGKWYRLRDNGIGTLVPDIDGTGSGTVNYAAGSCILTCAALPDVGSGILFTWGAPLEVANIAQDVTITMARMQYQLPSAPVRPGSLNISWPAGTGTATAADDGQGLIAGDAMGSINYATGQLAFTPGAVPAMGASYTIT